MAAFFRSYIAPALIVLIFAIAMLAVSARIFLPTDMMAPAPVDEADAPASLSQVDLLPGLVPLVHGQPDLSV